MFNKKGDFSLLIKLFIGIIVGILIGVIGNKMTVHTKEAGILIQVIGSIKHILGQIIFFTIPLVIIGFITASIMRLGQNASKILFTTVFINYLSSVGAAFLAILLGFIFIPKLNIPNTTEGLLSLPELLFTFNIPMIMPVMSALVFAIMIGIAALLTKAKQVSLLFNELEQIVMFLVNKVIVPLLPFFIAATFAELAYTGSLTKQLPIFIFVIIIALFGHFIWMLFLYGIGGLIAKKNPFEVLRHYGAAYLTAIGTMSSAATLPVAIKCASQSKVLSKDTVDFVIPIGATTHLCGSVLTETFFCMTIFYLFKGTLPDLSTIVLFSLLLGIFAVGAPGVPGGTVMASLGIVTSVLGFDTNMVALLLAIFALQDSFGTACNVTSDGAVALMIEGIFPPTSKV